MANKTENDTKFEVLDQADGFEALSQELPEFTLKYYKPDGSLKERDYVLSPLGLRHFREFVKLLHRAGDSFKKYQESLTDEDGYLAEGKLTDPRHLSTFLIDALDEAYPQLLSFLAACIRTEIPVGKNETALRTLSPDQLEDPTYMPFSGLPTALEALAAHPDLVGMVKNSLALRESQAVTRAWGLLQESLTTPSKPEPTKGS